MDKKQLSERDICTKYINPSIEGAGWDLVRQVREEVSFTDGRIIVQALMALCDELEQQIETSHTQVEQLMQSCLKEVFSEK